MVGAAPPVGPVAHQRPAAQDHQGQVAVDPLVVGQVGRRSRSRSRATQASSARSRARDAVGGQVGQRLVVLGEPEDAAERRAGGALVGDQLGGEPVEGAVTRGDRHGAAR